jgi:hypothetical protein
VFEWILALVSLIPLWGVLAAGTYGGILAARSTALGYVLLGGIAVIGLPIAVSVSLPLLRSRARRVFLDGSSGNLCFENVFVHNGFHLPRTRRNLDCPLQDILWVQFIAGFQRGPDWLLISTT